jgi:hypothetical protein
MLLKYIFDATRSSWRLLSLSFFTYKNKLKYKLTFRGYIRCTIFVYICGKYVIESMLKVRGKYVTIILIDNCF